MRAPNGETAIVTREAAPMLIRCPTCSSAYDLPPDFLAERFRVLRCARCRDSWTIAPGGRTERPFDPRDRRNDGPEIVAEARSARRASATPFPRASRRQPRPPGKPAGSRSGALTAAVLLGLIAGAMAGVARKDLVVRFYPPSAGVFEAIGLPVNLRGLAFADIHGAVADSRSPPVLTLEGKIRNVRGETTAVPALRIAIRDKAHNELYSWTAPAPKPRLQAGETIAFRNRLAAPPEGGQDLMVSFADPTGEPRVRSERQ